jgi:DNA-binding IclR family transcriptional regulator
VAEGTGTAVARDKQDNAKIILDLLARHKAMSLVELMSVVEMPDSEVRHIVENLESKNLVRVSQRGTLDEIVAIREQGLRAAG